MMHLIQDIVFEEILKCLKSIKGIHKRNINGLRVFLGAIFFISRTGCQWRLLPSYYGKWRTIHKRFKSWSDRGIWKKIFETGKIDLAINIAMIDATIVRAHACAAGYGKNTGDREALGRSKGGYTTKIHAIVDAHGKPVRFSLTAGQRNDITQAVQLSSGLQSLFMIGDKGYDCKNYLDYLNSNGCTPVIPPRSNRKYPQQYDIELYKQRNKIECFFGKIKHYRRVFSRFDKTANSYLSIIYFVSTLIWLK